MSASIGRALILTVALSIVAGCGGFSAKTRSSFQGDEAYSRAVIRVAFASTTQTAGTNPQDPSIAAYAESRLAEAVRREGLTIVDVGSATAQNTVVVKMTIDITDDSQVARPVTGVGAKEELVASTLVATDFTTNAEKFRATIQSGPDRFGGSVRDAARSNIDTLTDAFDLHGFVAPASK